MPNEISIVPYEDRRHREQVAELWRSVFGYESARNDPGLAIDKKVAAADGLFFVAELGEAVVGTVMAGYDGHRGWIYSLAVMPACQRKGLGTDLMQRAEAELTKRGCVKINLQLLEGNRQVEAFYQKLGYATEPRISMGKTILEDVGEAR